MWGLAWVVMMVTLTLARAVGAEPAADLETSYRALRSTFAELRRARLEVEPAGPAGALGTAEDNVRAALGELCGLLHRQRLEAARQALLEQRFDAALDELERADGLLGECAEYAPRAVDPDEPPPSARALSRRGGPSGYLRRS